MKRNLTIAASVAAALTATIAGAWLLGANQVAQAADTAVQAPKFEVDPLWPKPLPNNWVIGQTIGLAVDAQDNVWIIHRRLLSKQKNRISLAKNPTAARPRPMCWRSTPTAI